MRAVGHYFDLRGGLRRWRRLTALHARLSTLPATALRGDVLPERVPAEGLLILRDGEPGEPAAPRS